MSHEHRGWEGEPVAAITGESHAVFAIGRVAVERDGNEVKLQAGQRQLLALLIAAGPRGVSADRLGDEIWGEGLPTTWQNSLRVAVSRLRKRTGLTVPSVGGAYRLEIDPAGVDVWELFRTVDESASWRLEMDSLLSSPECFPTVEPSPLLQQTAARVTAAQQHLIELLAAHGGRSSRRLLEALVSHLGDDASDDRLVHAIATIHVDSGASATALGLIQRCRRDRQDLLGVDIAPELILLEQRLRDSPDSIDALEPSLAPRPLPRQLARYRAEQLVGRAAEQQTLLDAVSEGQRTVAIVRGQAGAGKTALLAELASEVGPDIHVVYVAGTDGGPIGLGPLTAAISGFAAEVEAVDALGLDPVGRMGMLATRLVRLVAGGTKRSLLLVDDAHWLDSPTCDLLNFLVRSGDSGSPMTLVFAARDEHRKSAWADLEQSLARSTEVLPLDLAPLGPADLSRLVATARPELSLTARHQLAVRLESASAGLPEVALRLLEIGLEGQVGNDSEAGVFDRLVAGLDDWVAEIAVGSAVLGRSFSASQLLGLLDTPEDVMLDAIDVLVRRNLVMETGSLDRFEFSHQLLVDALLRSVTKSRRTHLHYRAAGLVDGIHELSRHQLASGPLTDTASKLETVIASARAHLRHREFWESANEFRQAFALEDVELGPDVYVDFATALSISGARGASLAIRQQAYERALAAGRWDLVLAAACSGLPEAEVPDGEEDRLVHLRSIPGEELTPPERLLQSLTAARLAAQLGLTDEARQWVERASSLASTDEERCEAALCERFVGTVEVPPAERLRRLTNAFDSLTVPLPMHCRQRLFCAVDLLELGEIDRAAARHEEASAAAIELNDPLRQWHTMIFGSLLLETAGELDEAAELADRAQRLGHRFGIAQAEIVRLAQMSSRLELTGQLATLVGLIDLIPVSDANSLLFGAGKVRVLHAAGRHDLAVAQAADLTRRVLDEPSSTSHGVIGLVASSLSQHPDKDLRRNARRALAPFEGGAMVLGVGLRLLPSVSSLCTLLDDDSERGSERALQIAIEDCDRSGFVAWSIRYRLELAELTGSTQLATEAGSLAETTGLAQHLAPTNRVA